MAQLSRVRNLAAGVDVIKEALKIGLDLRRIITHSCGTLQGRAVVEGVSS